MTAALSGARPWLAVPQEVPPLADEFPIRALGL